MLLACGPYGLCGAWFEDQQHGPSPAEQASWTMNSAHPILNAAKEQLQAYFKGQLHNFSLPLQWPQATPFQLAVWQILLRIPFGHTSSYGQLAAQLQNPQAVRAVGAAVGRNPLSIIVPCHRVLGKNGALTGYAGGLPRKQSLLKLEGHDFSPAS
jgi:methylated-DNA-[protein]-cysteine S-methyltransferase